MARLDKGFHPEVVKLTLPPKCAACGFDMMVVRLVTRTSARLAMAGPLSLMTVLKLAVRGGALGVVARYWRMAWLPWTGAQGRVIVGSKQNGGRERP